MAVPDDTDATNILENSSGAGDYYNFDKSDTGIVFLENNTNSAGDSVKLYGSYGDHSTDFFIKEWTNSDMDGATLADAFSPVPAYIKAVPQTGSWTVIIDGDW